MYVIDSSECMQFCSIFFLVVQKPYRLPWFTDRKLFLIWLPEVCQNCNTVLLYIFGGAYSCEWCFGCILWIPILANFERKSGYLFFKLFLRMLLVKSVKLQTKRKKKKRIPVGISASYVSLHEKHNKYLLQKLTHLIIS